MTNKRLIKQEKIEICQNALEVLNKTLVSRCIGFSHDVYKPDPGCIYYAVYTNKVFIKPCHFGIRFFEYLHSHAYDYNAVYWLCMPFRFDYVKRLEKQIKLWLANSNYVYSYSLPRRKNYTSSIDCMVINIDRIVEDLRKQYPYVYWQSH